MSRRNDAPVTTIPPSPKAAADVHEGSHGHELELYRRDSFSCPANEPPETVIRRESEFRVMRARLGHGITDDMDQFAVAIALSTTMLTDKQKRRVRVWVDQAMMSFPPMPLEDQLVLVPCALQQMASPPPQPSCSNTREDTESSSRSLVPLADTDNSVGGASFNSFPEDASGVLATSSVREPKSQSGKQPPDPNEASGSSKAFNTSSNVTKGSNPQKGSSSDPTTIDEAEALICAQLGHVYIMNSQAAR